MIGHRFEATSRLLAGNRSGLRLSSLTTIIGNYALPAIWSTVECCLGIVAGCLPTMRPILRELNIIAEPSADASGGMARYKGGYSSGQARSDNSRLADGGVGDKLFGRGGKNGRLDRDRTSFQRLGDDSYGLALNNIGSVPAGHTSTRASRVGRTAEDCEEQPLNVPTDSILATTTWNVEESPKGREVKATHREV